MTSINKTSNKTSAIWKMVSQAVTLGAFAIAPVAVGTLTAQADPPDHAPAHGYRSRQSGEYSGRGSHRHDDDDDDDDRHYSRDGRYNDGRYSDGRYNNDYNNSRYGNQTNQYQSLSGIVVNDPRGNEFTVRTGNGNTVRVRAEDGEPRRLDNGDSVRLYGRYTNGVFLARNVDITRNTSQRNDRTNRGGYINRGGYNGGYNNDRYNDYDYGSGYGSNDNINFPATVVDVSERSNTMRVRAGNGRTYTVRSDKAENFNRGDRVRIKGRSRNGVVIADKIEKR